MNREQTFYTDAVGNTTNGESLTNANALTSDYAAFEYLNTLTVAFDDLCMYANFVARCKYGNVAAELFFLQSLDDVHLYFPP